MISLHGLGFRVHGLGRPSSRVNLEKRSRMLEKIRKNRQRTKIFIMNSESAGPI